MASVLVIEDEPLLARNIRESLALSGHEASTSPRGEDGLEAAARNPPDIILLDLRLPGIDGMDVLRELRRRGSTASIVMMTAFGNIDEAVEAMKCGASDYLTKPLDLKALDMVIDRVLRHRRVSANLDYLRERERSESAVDQMIGRSPGMLAVKRLLERIVSTQALASKFPPTLLLTGETGTGKDLVARAVHYAGARRDGPFVPVNCTALPEHLAEAELFGHVKGAFTDARGEKRGLFEVADGGTLFLDEIGHMKLSLQAKLLGALEDRTIRPVGGISSRQVNTHVIAATNRNLPEAIRAGEFREDLYHRLRVLTIHLPPLRERGDDMLLLARHFLGLYANRFGIPVTEFSEEALAGLRGYDWPGNVRELSHVIESAVLIADGPRIRPEHLSIHVPQVGERMTIRMPGAEPIELDFGRPESCPRLEEIEHQIIRSALEYCKYNLSRAARILGISRDAVRYRMEKHAKGAEGSRLTE